MPIVEKTNDQSIMINRQQKTPSNIVRRGLVFRAPRLLCLPLLCAVPIVHVFAGPIARDTVALLDLALQLFALAVYVSKIVVGELAPLLLDFAFHLFPVAFDTVPIHAGLHSLVIPAN